MHLALLWIKTKLNYFRQKQLHTKHAVRHCQTNTDEFVLNGHNTGNTSHHRVTPPHVSSICEAWRQQHMKAAALPQSLPPPLIHHLRIIKTIL